MISEFVISAVEKEQWPESDLPEVVVVGRSNVGKSSFINALTNKKKLAYVGNTPGKTRLINFFKIDDTWMLVDVPGYGYAKMSKQMLIKMGKMMDTYFNQREQICCVVQLVDARHGATHDDLDMIEMIQSLGIQIVINNGLPFDVKIPSNKILNEDELTKEELAKELLAAHDEVLKGNTIPFDQFYESLKKDLKL